MERILEAFQRRASYEPLRGGSIGPDGEAIEGPKQEGFFWTTYSIFCLLGVAMLWAWNMFLAANPYFQTRFQSNEKIAANFQSVELSVSTLANLGFMLILTKMQAKASYPKRIMTALVINIVTFTLLAISTRTFLGVSAGGYLGFLVLMVFTSSLATGLMQNGVFAYVAGFGREEYNQAIMTGQGIAGVLPCIAQIIAVFSVPEHKADAKVPEESSKSAFGYFLTATIISSIALVAYVWLLSWNASRHHNKRAVSEIGAEGNQAAVERESVPLLTLLRKLFWLAAAVFLTFAVTMVFPVFTGNIDSVRAGDDVPRLLQPAAFIPLAFLFWNIGDLTGRMLPAIPAISLTSRPRMLFILSAARVMFIPLYMLCNIRERGAKVESDFFYLVIVQLLFGLTNGYIGSSCMMGFVEWVDVGEREVAGGFMSLCLVAGLTAGSLSSFLAAKLVS